MARLDRHLATFALVASLTQHRARADALAITQPSGAFTGQASRPRRLCRCSHAESWTARLAHHVAATVALRRGRRVAGRHARCRHCFPWAGGAWASCAGARSSLHQQHRPLAAAADGGPALTTTTAATAAASSPRRPGRRRGGTPDGWPFFEGDAPLVSLALPLALLLAD